jgi:large subunit ribosomal protein L15
MNLHTLSPNPGAKRRVKRLGCGESSGHGKTSCKGNKGQKARSGGGTRVGFEGGQMPLHRRLPKRGFSTAKFRKLPGVVNLNDLDAAFEAGATVDEAALCQIGLINGAHDYIKVLGTGEITKALTLVVDRISAAAREKIEKAGGTVQTPA